jgi:Ser/Thr protein kinase RdoA (MazF antagonist)
VRTFESLTQKGRLRRLRGVAAEALRHFDVPEHRLTFQGNSFNTLFRVSCPDRAYLLRVGPERRIHELGAALAEHDWTAELDTRGLRAPRIVLTTSGSASVYVAASGVPGRRECTLLSWRTGRTLTRPVLPRDVADVAALSAAFHDASASRRKRPSGVLDGRLALHFKIPNLINEAPHASRAAFREALVRAQHGLNVLWKDASDAPRVIHSDLTPSNVLRSRGRLAAIDFQDLTWGHVEQDLANTIYGITRGADNEETMHVFRLSYEQVRPWPQLGKELLADLFAARRLEMVNLALFLNRTGLIDYLDHHAVALRAYLE